MSEPVILADVWRGGRIESRHRGHAVICTAGGDTVAAWGDPEAVIYPRSSCKMIQALPLVESGAADRAGLTSEHLALACASHSGAAMHVTRVEDWLKGLGMSEADLRCGIQMPGDRTERHRLRADGTAPCQCHNNCSGKHAGFLTLSKHLQAGPEYCELDHPVQLAVRDAFEDMTGERSAGYGIDGCSAPNFTTSLTGLARAAARMADTSGLRPVRAAAAERLVAAMGRHPLLIAGEGRGCSELVAAMDGRTVIKTGAEGVYLGILPDRGLGIALKVEDGATRASEAAIAALLVRLSQIEADHPAVQRRMKAELRNRRDLLVGHVTASEEIFAGGAAL
ncbi:asparaginase [Oceanomicrobium pacificus]|uniref:Asparaginase n=1 Tax=Oceanomicrobium pacificus TaxID=2692916 RepID=A0A6B0TJG5_9RHOB|nr:asparaginase [Oceanomicrobium pacificus]MXU64620.1 asparaginase [Oceanomicrobium pacificus]